MHEFLVASHGLSASYWLAYSLNLHPDIVCIHGSDRSVVSDQDELDIDRLLERGGPGLLFRKLQDIRAGAEARQGGFDRQQYDRWMSEIYPGSGIVGSVHSFRMRDFEKIETTALSGLTVCNLIRHPVSLVNSGCGLLSRSFLYDLNELRWTASKVYQDDISFVESLSAEYNLKPGENETLSFFGACVMMKGLSLDAEVCESMKARSSYLGEFRMEALTSDREAFARLIKGISEDTLDSDGDYLDRVFESDRLNAHSNRRNVSKPGHVWDQWAPWQRKAFQHYFEKYGIRSFYGRLGYDFSFM